MTTEYTASFRVYWEDTDAGGVVYYANYLKFAERARTELLREHDIHQSTLAETHGVLFVVRHAEIDLKSPARLDDLLTVTTKITQQKAASLHMQQIIQNQHGVVLADISITIACIDTHFKPTRIPKKITESLTN